MTRTEASSVTISRAEPLAAKAMRRCSHRRPSPRHECFKDVRYENSFDGQDFGKILAGCSQVRLEPWAILMPVSYVAESLKNRPYAEGALAEILAQAFILFSRSV